ncbi:putative glycosyltransferase [Staphylococcus piscifermentans]|uniref:Uncharacterized protein n=3 Tax=Staphylococcus piscifermentans TaxID=70258 RepID=A0A239TK46_9STAP|nr:CDP-glycerol glycerophosphotransferase family protein [Staphylococcus piscifermentans]GEP85218.1 hypothetical protein SPI02_18030 [Staphylococcus piscifermentans]SNU98136.1 putative glycosyltransferase [Staphylococcus piscifermentans]
MPTEKILNEAQYELSQSYDSKYEKILAKNLGQRIIEHYNNYKNEEIESKTILYETFHGKSLTDNPYAIFKKLIHDEKFRDYQHIWVINNSEPYKDYQKIKNVKFVSVNSDGYLYYLATAKYLINNTSFPPYFLKRKEQIYLNTWHGTPLKTLGKDMKGPLNQLKNLQRNFIQADYILSPNAFTTEKLAASHNLIGIYEGEFLETGYPRIDLITETKEKDIIKKLKKYIKVNPKKKLVLYAPTWRGNVGEEKDIKKEIKDIIKNMQNNLGDGYQLLLKVHPLLFKFFKNDKELGAIFIPDFIDMCEILSVIDVLITDYSSVFFDFYVRNKPIILYTYDKEEYLKERGTYLKFEDLGCYIANSQKELNQLLQNPGNLKGCAVNEFVEWQDGTATDKVIKALFYGTQNLDYAKKISNIKKNVLIFVDEFNGKDFEKKITFINNISRKENNIIVLTKDKLKYEEENQLKQLIGIKLFFRFGKLNVGKELWTEYMLLMEQQNVHLNQSKLEQISTNEIHRLLGYIEINKIYNLSNDKFWKNILGNFPIASKLKFQYLEKNDLQSIEEDEFFFNKNENRRFEHFISFEAGSLAIKNNNKDIQFIYSKTEKENAKSAILEKYNNYFIPIVSNSINTQYIMVKQNILNEDFILIDVANKSIEEVMSFYYKFNENKSDRAARLILINVSHNLIDEINQEIHERDIVMPVLKEEADLYHLARKSKFYFVLEDLKDAFYKVVCALQNGIDVKVCDESYINKTLKLDIEYVDNWESFLPLFKKYDLVSSSNKETRTDERVEILNV